MEHVVVTRERAHAGLLARPVAPGDVLGLELRLVLVVVLNRCHCGIDRHVEVVVEAAAERRDPTEVPSHAPLVRDELVERRARHHDERDIVVLEVRDAAGEAVGDRRAARTAFVPVRPEHEVIDEHLRTPAEQIAQRRIAVFGREPVVVLKRHPGQVTPPSRKLVAAARQFPFSFEQLEARCEPFVASAECVGCHRRFVSFACRAARATRHDGNFLVQHRHDSALILEWVVRPSSRRTSDHPA